MSMETTRRSLLDRLKAGQGQQDWETFYEIYAAVAIRYGMRKGLKEDEAFDVLQETMVALMKILPEFNYDPARGKFRNFMFTIVHRKALAALRRRQRRAEISLDAPVGPEDGRTLYDTRPELRTAPSLEEEALWRESIRDEALRRMYNDATIEARTLSIFKEYVMDGDDAGSVARRHGIKENAVYQIKNRLLRKLQEEVNKILQASEP